MNPSSSGTQGQEFINWQCALLAGLIIKYPDLTLALARAIRSGDDRRSNFRTAIERHASLLDPDFNVAESCVLTRYVMRSPGLLKAAQLGRTDDT